MITANLKKKTSALRPIGLLLYDLFREVVFINEAISAGKSWKPLSAPELEIVIEWVNNFS